MARSKNATALFEVIHTAKKPPKSSASVSVPTPKWWAKSRSAPAKPAAVDAPETAGKQGSWLAAARRSVPPASVREIESATVTSDSSALVASESPAIARHFDSPGDATDTQTDSEPDITDSSADDEAPLPASPKPRFAERFARRAAAAIPVEPINAMVESPPAQQTAIEPADDVMGGDSDDEFAAPSPSAPARPSRDSIDEAVAVDRGAKEVRFRLSYGGLISLAIIFLLVMTLAFLIGSRYASQSSADAQDTAQKPSDPLALALSPKPDANPAESNPAHPLATNTDTTTDAARTQTAAPVVIRPDVLAVSRHSKPPAKTHRPPSAAAALAAKIAAVGNPVREVGAIYIIAQSYPEKPLAQKACDFLNKAGVTCSLVQGLDGWAPRDWFSVVGFQPFASHDPTLKEYESKVTALGLKFSNKVYNQFEPRAYTWRASSDSHDSSGDSGDEVIER